MIIAFVAAALFFGYGTAYVASGEVRYLTRAGLEETQILKAPQADRQGAARTLRSTRRSVASWNWSSRRGTPRPDWT